MKTSTDQPGPESVRCPWARASPLEVRYHDREWGVPVWNDARLFELLTLEGAQAGLSWSTILAKRTGYRRAFARFDASKVARFGKRDVRRLLRDASIVRHAGKIESTIDNARCILAVLEEYETLADYLWDLVGGEPRQNRWRTMAQVPASTEASKAMSRELRRRGFRYVGPTTCYAFMQAVGMVNDHLVGCFRYAEVATQR